MVNQLYRNISLALVLCALPLAAPANVQSLARNTIMGKVRTDSGQPLANVLVELQAGTGAVITQTVTSNEGDYAFTSLEGASFLLVVNEPDHQPFAERVELTRIAATRPGETVRIDIMLIPKARAATSHAGLVFQQEVPPAALEVYRRGVKLLAERKSDEALAALSEAIRIFPNYFDAHFAIGLEMFRLRRYDNAIEELERARAINPKDSRLYHTFGLVLFEQKKYRLAAMVFDAAARLSPTNAEARLMRGAALIEIGQLDMAEAELKRADQISAQKLAIVHLHLARVYEKRGDRRRAADELEIYLRKQPEAINAPAIREAIKKLRAG